MVLKEFRIPMPVNVDEYHIGQLFTLMEASRENTNGDSAVEIITNEPFENEYGKGQYTHKVFYLGSKLPRMVAALLPASAKMLVEKAWNAYPHCRTEYSNPFLGDRFQIIIQSVHLPDNGTNENAHNLTPAQLAEREVIYIDIAKDKVNEQMKPNTDPSQFVSNVTGRGPLTDGWQKTSDPVMCCYKLVTIKFQVWGFQTKVESLIQENQIQILTKFHKEIFCAIDRWANLDMADIRRMEVEIKEELDKKIAAGEIAMVEPSVTPVESVKSNPF